MVTSLKTREVIQTEEGMSERESPVVLSGYILDADDEYYYVGKTPDEVAFAVRRSEVVYITIQRLTDVYEEILNQMDDPESDVDLN